MESVISLFIYTVTIIYIQQFLNCDPESITIGQNFTWTYVIASECKAPLTRTKHVYYWQQSNVKQCPLNVCSMNAFSLCCVWKWKKFSLKAEEMFYKDYINFFVKQNFLKKIWGQAVWEMRLGNHHILHALSIFVMEKLKHFVLLYHSVHDNF